MRGRRTLLPLLTAALVAAAAVSCDDPTGPDVIEITATVQFQAVEGGCWSLLSADGTRYEPLELTDPFRLHGLEVEATVRRRTDMGTTCQIGQVVEVLVIRQLESVVPPD